MAKNNKDKPFGHDHPNQEYFGFEDENIGTWQLPENMEDAQKRKVLVIGKNKELSDLLNSYDSVLTYTTATTRKEGREYFSSRNYRLIIVDDKIDKTLKKNIHKDLAANSVTIYDIKDVKSVEQYIQNNYLK
jgi:signal transduction protein with GAF and PtsI domain